MPDEIYQGAMYEPGRVQSGGAPQLQAIRPVAQEAVGRGMQQTGAELAAIGRALRDRFDYCRKSEADTRLRMAEAQFDSEMKEGMAAPYGTAKSLYDANGMLREGRYETILGRAMRAGERAGKGIVNPMDGEEWAVKTQNWGVSLSAKGRGLLAVDARNKARTAYENRRKAALAGRDFEGAEQMAYEAHENQVISADEAEADAIESRRGWMGKRIEEMLVAGDVEGIQGMIDRGELNKWMTPMQQDSYLRRAQEMRKEKSIDALNRVWSLPAAEVANAQQEKAKRPWEVTGAFTQAQARLIDRMMSGEDVSAQLRAEAINEARAYPASGDYEKWAAGYALRWKALGLSDGEISKALADAVQRRKRMEGMRVIEAKTFENSVRNLSGALSPAREEALRRTIYDKDGKIHARFEAKSEWRKQNEGRWGISPDDDEEVAAGKYYRKKYDAIMDEQLALVNNKYNEWLDTEEGEKSTPVAQRRQYQAIFKEICERDIELRSVAGYENAYQAVKVEQDKQYGRYMRGGYVAIDNAQYPDRVIRRGQIGILANAEKKEAGVYLPEGLKGKVTPGRDGVLCTGEHGGYRELPVLGFVKGEQMQISREAAAQMAVNVNEPPTWQWQIVRADEHKRLMRAQENNARLESIKQGYVPPNTSAARVMPQPGYNEPQDAERMKSYMGGALAAHYDTFMAAAKENNLDPKLLIAIAMNESARGTSYAARTRHNLFGRWDANAINPRTGARGYHKYYRDADESIRDIARHLRKEYLDKGYTSIETIARKYAPVGAENDPGGLNGGWPEAVGRFYQQLSNL